MSENHFYNDDFDFENLIKQKSDQFKMYPSAQAWKGIHSALHTPLSWYVTGLFLLTAAISLYVLDPFTPSSKTLAQQKPQKSQSSKKTTTSEENRILPFSQSAISPNLKVRKKISNLDVDDDSDDSTLDETIASNDFTPVLSTVSLEEISKEQFGKLSLQRNSNIEKTTAKVIPITSSLRSSPISLERQEAIEADIENISTKETKDVSNNPVFATPDPILTDEDVTNQMFLSKNISIAKPKISKSRWQISVSPTMNFRLLRNSTEVITASNNQVIPIALKVKGDVNQYVKHMPAVGMEIGSLYLFSINPRWSVKVGGQFNFSRYYIQAFNTNVPEIAKINLGTSPAGIGTTPITTYSKIRNLSGNSYKGIQNQYYQIAAPVGLEYVLLGKRKLQLNLAGTLQPTFLLNRNSYLITTDYKNYTRQPSLVRQWNLNTSGEAFISYKATHYKFQLGPQFRYQLFSTFEQKYPIKEYLMEYGVKFAVTR